MAEPLGKKIIATIRSVLGRCEEVGEKVGYPGEGGERRFRKPRILSPTLVRPEQLRFVLDEAGYLSDHACLMIQPTKKTERAWEDFEGKMADIMESKLTRKELLQYCIAFLNSSYAQQRLVRGHRPTPKGSYAITEAFMDEIPIPAPHSKKVVRKIIDLVDDLERKVFDLTKKDEVQEMEERLQGLVTEALAAVPA